LAELTSACRQLTGKVSAIDSLADTAPVDVRIYITDARRAMGDFGWRPRYKVPVILEETCVWFRDNWEMVRPVFQ